MLRNDNAAFFWTQFRARVQQNQNFVFLIIRALGVRYANKKIFFTLLFFFTVTTLNIWGVLYWNKKLWVLYWNKKKY